MYARRCYQIFKTDDRYLYPCRTLQNQSPTPVSLTSSIPPLFFPQRITKLRQRSFSFPNHRTHVPGNCRPYLPLWLLLCIRRPLWNRQDLGPSRVRPDSQVGNQGVGWESERFGLGWRREEIDCCGRGEGEVWRGFLRRWR